MECLWLKIIGTGCLAVMLSAQGPAADPPVADAVMQGDVETLRELVRKGADVNAAQGDGMTALHWTAQKGLLKAAEILIHAGAHVEVKTRLGALTPLLLASRAGSADVVEVLLKAGANPNVRTTNGGATPLHFAAYSDDGRSVELLLQYGTEIDARDEASGHTPLMYAAAYNSLDAAQVLLANGADLSLSNKTIDMAKRAREDERLGPRGSNQFARSREEREEDESRESLADRVGIVGGWTALHLAAREGNAKVVKALVEAGASLDQMSEGRHSTALVVAFLNGHWDLGMYLLEKGADPIIADGDGMTPLLAILESRWAAWSFHPRPRTYRNQEVEQLEAMEALLKAGADPNARLNKTPFYWGAGGVDIRGATPFWRAAYALDIEAMKLLYEYGADATIATWPPPPRRSRNDSGDSEDPSGLPPVSTGDRALTALHAATGAGYGVSGSHAQQHNYVPGNWMRATKYLVEEHGLDVNARDDLGFTPLHNAAARGDEEMILYLVGQGADVTAVSRAGQTTADMANSPQALVDIPPFPDAITLLRELGSDFNGNCASC